MQRLEEDLNRGAEGGWEVLFQVVEKRRFLFLRSRDAIIVYFAREREPEPPLPEHAPAFCPNCKTVLARSARTARSDAVIGAA